MHCQTPFCNPRSGNERRAKGRHERCSGLPRRDIRRCALLPPRAQMLRNTAVGGCSRGGPHSVPNARAEPQVERHKHEDDADVGHQPLPEVVFEEQDIHAHHNGYQSKHIERDGGVSSHVSSYVGGSSPCGAVLKGAGSSVAATGGYGLVVWASWVRDARSCCICCLPRVCVHSFSRSAMIASAAWIWAQPRSVRQMSDERRSLGSGRRSR
jgi:hypothetical protein